MSPNLRPLSPQLQEAAKELGEDPRRLEKDIQHIKDWLKQQPHLTARTDDQWIVTFLRGCKFSLEKTKHKMDMYYTMKTAAPELFANRDPLEPKIQEILNAGFITYLPQLDKHGQRVTVLRLGQLDPKKVTGEDIFRMNFMGGDAALLQDDAAVLTGTVALIDLKGCSLSHAALFGPATVKKCTTVLQDAYPLRMKAMHFVNAPSFSEALTGLFLPLMKEKIRRRVVMHSNLDSLLEYFDKDILPNEYGGSAGPIEIVAAPWRKRFESLGEFFKEDGKYRSDETKRPGKPKTSSDLFGVEGSFRQLVVD
ncbi:alpha-tocopherol transfer protein-like [Schistocerca americana]|uniref:alpha-tocopherol transfer protein-like n=1 Tax=Schistocerca americana TaxID=7009 RepID=UPI001F4FB340|nr:alpha-tocopherol transfer protein-like [Schistocerca americana]